MIVNVIMLIVTAMVGLFVLVWLFLPSSRHWFEKPKYKFLHDELKSSRPHLTAEEDT